MKQVNTDDLNRIPFWGKDRANQLAVSLINDGYFAEPVLQYIPFFDAAVSDSLLGKAIEQDADIHAMLMAVYLFTRQDINDYVTRKAIELEIDINTIVGKVYLYRYHRQYYRGICCD
ncbi:MAG: hypothetical protein HFE78_07605 [Clostridiales bacterium]|nr:hypothetical protein [Clostridiales bacterium]